MLKDDKPSRQVGAIFAFAITHLGPTHFVFPEIRTILMRFYQQNIVQEIVILIFSLMCSAAHYNLNTFTTLTLCSE